MDVRRHVPRMPLSAVLTVALAAALVAALPAAGVAAEPGTVIGLSPTQDLWGYAVGLRAHKSSYLPGSAESRDDMGTAVTIAHVGTGAYRIRYPDDYATSPPEGTLLATAISTTGTICSTGDFGPQQEGSSHFTQTFVFCFDRNGQLTDSRFSTNYVVLQTLTGHSAYLFSGSAPPSGTYAPDPDYQFNSTGGTNTVTRTGVGRYTVTLPGLASNGGNVQLSFDGGGGSCSVASLGPGASAEFVRVVCRTAAGAPTDGAFDLLYTHGQGLKQKGAKRVAYLEADRPLTASYTPASALRYSSTGMPLHVARTGTGSYTVTLKGFSGGGAAEVTTVTQGKARCVLAAAPSGSPTVIHVVCSKPNGTPADTRFELSYSR